METDRQIKINDFLSKAIIFFIYLFAFGLFTSKESTNVSGLFICLLGLLQMVIIKENPLKKIKDKTLNLPILVFSTAMFIPFLDNPDADIFSRFSKHLLVFLFFYIVVFNLHNLSQVKRIITALSLSMGLSAIYGIYQHCILKIPRVEGFSFILSFGCFVAFFLIFLITYDFWGETKVLYRLALFAGTALMGANLLFTQARGAWLGFLGGVLTLIWIKNKKILVPFIIVCLVIASLLPQTYIERFKSSFDIKNNDSNLARIALWKSALLMYRDHWINGVGLDRFEEEYITNYKQPLEIRNPCHAHNNILQYMAETGTLGLIAFVWLMVAIVIWLYKNYQSISNVNWRLFPLASLCGMISYNIQGLTEVNYGTGDITRFLWLIIALNVVIVEQCKENPLQNKQL